MPRARALAALLAALLAGACGGPCAAPTAEEPSRAEAPAAGAPAPAGAPEPDAPEPGALPPLLPAAEPGGVAVSYARGRVSLVSRGARLGDVLRELGRAARFAVAGGGAETDRPVRARIADAALVDALSQLLRGSDWGTEYVADGRGGHRLARLRVGPAPEPPAGEEEGRQAAEFGAAMDRELFGEGQDEEPVERPRWTADDEARREAELDAELASANAERRAEAVEELDSTLAEDFERLVRFARDDPDPAVRVTAIEALEGDTSYGALRALAGALGDPDPEVVVSAIEALAALEDETVVPELALLREHRDPDVRDAAEAALEVLEE
jgi:hypothetical protein